MPSPKKLYSSAILLLTLLIVSAIIIFVFNFKKPEKTEATVAENTSGWAWSENIGWISFNNTSGGGGVPYGVNIDPATGNVSGYAWAGGGEEAGSPTATIGWIRFDAPPDFDTGVYPTCPISTCPSGSPSHFSNLDFTTDKITGWARACAGTVNGDCNSSTRADGWDGWILLGPIFNGGTDYGAWVDTALNPKELKGWAWGSDVVGWISLNCANQGVCGASNYKVVTSVSYPPKAINLSTDSFDGTVCGVTSGAQVRFRWTFSDLGDTQSAYQVQANTDPTFVAPPTLDTGKVMSASDNFLNSPPSYSVLAWGTQYFWRVKVWDSSDAQSVWANGASFTTPVHSYPYPDFVPLPSKPSAGEMVVFTDSSKCYNAPGNVEYNCNTNAGNRYQWDFTDDATIDCDSNVNPLCRGNTTSTYSSVGETTVRLKVTDGLGTCDKTKKLNVTLPLPDWRPVAPK